MNIKLNWARIQNFKGIKDLLIQANGKSLNIYGNNATGKTSTVDSIEWLLFDKDSNNNADTKFTIKPQDELGQDINHLQTVVEVELLVDGKQLKLKKMREENWVTRRGTIEPVMDGHSKKYWFNEVPCKAREYQSKINGLIKENIFKMITDPLFFNTKLKWEERREILLEISGDATDEEVIASDESLSKLAQILNGRSIDDYKLVLADQLKGLKKERDNLPPRIDELTLSLPQEEPDYTEIEVELNKHKETLSSIEFLMTNSTNKTNELNKKHQELYSLKSKLEEIKSSIKTEAGADRLKFIDKKRELQEGQYLLESGISSLKTQIDQVNKDLTANSITRKKLLDTWRGLSDEIFGVRSEKFEDKEVGVAKDCPTCQQKLPIETVQEKMEELRTNFEKDKKERLESLQLKIDANMVEGKSLKENTEKTNTTLIGLESELSIKEEKIKEITSTIIELDKDISKEVEEPDYTTNQDYNQLIKSIDDLQIELDKPVEDKSSELLQRKLDIQIKIDELNKKLNGKTETEKKKDRIEELKAEEKRVSSRIAELEGHKFMLERFIVAKVNLLEDSINSQFKHVKFRLFEENITNEGIKETCTTLVNSNGSLVDYNTNGNLAVTYNAGLDIINSLCQFYEVTAPIFFDNRESVSEIIETDSQIINLIKPPTWNELDKEVRDLLIKEQISKHTEILTTDDPIYHIDLAKKEWDDRNETLRVEVQDEL